MFSLMAIIQAVGFTTGMGAGSIASRLLGQDRKEAARQPSASGNRRPESDLFFLALHMLQPPLIWTEGPPQRRPFLLSSLQSQSTQAQAAGDGLHGAGGVRVSGAHGLVDGGHNHILNG